MERHFYKYSGAGNDFIILNTCDKPLELSEEQMKAFVKSAAGKSGIGSDGLILIDKSERAPFAMKFYNPDGSYGALCGNGARCAVQAAKDFHIVSDSETTFEVLGAINHAMLFPDGSVRVYLQDPKKIKF